ncbi:hypothetical protein [Saccharopolyspora shandongensis]|uniref:hypothetical protein n=1 Tax=Saccharopolyspora shandongensis TaxID=418495 RepID=UPI0033F9B133
MAPLVIELDPLRGAGPVLLGASHEAAGDALHSWGVPETYAPYQGALPLDWRVVGLGVDVVVHCSAGVVETIEIFRDFNVRPSAQVFLLGLDVFSVSAEQVMAAVVERFEIDDEDAYGFTVPALSVGLGRSIVPNEDSDAEDRDRYTCFDNILLAGPGYYDSPAAGK